MPCSFTEAELLFALPSVRRFALKLTHDSDRADDLIQDVVVRAYSKSNLFVGGDLGAWLRTMCHNQFVNNVRRSIREGVSDPTAVEHLRASGNVVDRIECAEVLRSLAALPRTQFRLIARAALNGDRYEELAAYEDVPVGTVRSRLSRARTALRMRSNGIELSEDELMRLE